MNPELSLRTAEEYIISARRSQAFSGRRGFFRYLYLEDLKVDRTLRGKGIGALLIGEAKKTALALGYRGLYTIGQDNNLAACLFYLKTGFRIGGLDTEVYKGTSQEGKADILFYLD